MTASPSEDCHAIGASLRAARLRRIGVAASVTLAASVGTGSAHADTSFMLSWRTEARACVVETELRGAVEQRLGRKPFTDPAHADLFIEAEEQAVGRGRFRATVTEKDRHGVIRGVRSLEPQSCENLRRAATLIVTLIIDPHGTGAHAEEPQEPAAPMQETPASSPEAPLLATKPPAVAREAPAIPEPRRQSLHLSLGIGGAAGIGVLPSLSATVFVVARLEPASSRWSFDWWGGYSFPQRLRDGPVHADFSAIEQRVRSCFGFARWSTHKFDVCGGVAFGAIVPQIVGVRQTSSHWRNLIGPTAAIAFEERVGAIATRIELGASFALRQYDFSYFGPDNERKSFYSTDALFFFLALSGVGRTS